MADDAEAFLALTLLLAASEQAVLVLESSDPPFEGRLVESIAAARDRVYSELSSGPRFAGRPDAG